MTEPNPPPPPPRPRVDWVNRGLVAALLLGAVVMGWQDLAGDDALLPTGTPAPDFALETLAGPRVRLDGLHGRVVVLDFWATWCPPCRNEMPWLVKLGVELQGQGVTFIAASQDDGDDQRQVVKAYAAEVPGLEQFAAFSAEQVAAAYRVRTLPALFVIDGQGRVAFSKSGETSEGVVRAAIEAARAAK